MSEHGFSWKTRGFGRRTRQAIRLTRWALTAERAARAFWPVVTILLFMAAAALLGLFRLLDPFWHHAVLIGCGLALLGALSVGIFRMRLPGLDDATRRLDREDPTRPLSTLTDTLAAGRDQRSTEIIWRAHVERAERAARHLRPRWPDLNLAPFDTWALRLLALVLLAGGILAAGSDWPDRLWSVAEPGKVAGAARAVPRPEPAAEAWATPPGYTGRDVVYLTELGAGDAAPALPEGSELTVRVTDFDGVPALEGDVLTGFEGFTGFGGGLSEARGVLSGSGTLRVLADDEVLADWTLSVTPDAPPEIGLTEPPLRAATGALDVRFEASDDYGVVSAWAEIVPAGGLEPGRGMFDEPVNFALPLPIARRAATVSDSAIRDLTAHPWAGAEVEMVLLAEDGAEQRGSSETVRFVLPERRFLNPLSRALVEQRRELALEFAGAGRVLDVLQAVTRQPEAIFEENHGAYMGVRTAIRRLAHGIFEERVAEVAPEVTELLWLAAVALEEGDLSDALARLRQAQQRLREALESGTDEEVAQALDELRQAMNDYLQELARQAMQNPMAEGQQPQPGQQMSQQDLQEMLDEIQRNAESGLRDQARDMLSELNRMLENLQAGNPQMQQGQGPGQQAMQQLQELIQRQRDLAGDTFDQLRQQGREGQSGPQGEQRGGQQGQMQQGEGEQQGQGSGRQGGQRQGQGTEPGRDGQPMPGEGDLAAQQRGLQEALEELARQLPGGPGGELGQALDEAGREMGEAVDDLNRQDNRNAIEDQMEAIDRLNEGANALAQQIQEGQGDTAAEGQGRGNEGRAQDRLESDPFDRPAGSYGAIDGRDTDLPDRSVLDRARELLEELRRRSSEPGRQQLELEYYDRLIDRF